MACPAPVPLLRKLAIKPGQRIVFVSAPPGLVEGLGPLPSGVTVEAEPVAPMDWLMVFVQSQAELRAQLTPLARALAPAGSLWVAWPKKSSGVASDLTEGVVQAAGLAAGLVDNKVCSVDATWSALRFVYRLADRPAVNG
jgi:hypothetical protein